MVAPAYVLISKMKKLSPDPFDFATPALAIARLVNCGPTRTPRLTFRSPQPTAGYQQSCTFWNTERTGVV
jgi:hypothetical protein